MKLAGRNWGRMNSSGYWGREDLEFWGEGCGRRGGKGASCMVRRWEKQLVAGALGWSGHDILRTGLLCALLLVTPYPID